MKSSILIILFCVALVGGLQFLGFLSLSPLILFLAAFGLSMIILMIGFIAFGKQQAKDK